MYSGLLLTIILLHSSSAHECFGMAYMYMYTFELVLGSEWELDRGISSHTINVYCLPHKNAIYNTLLTTTT